MWLVSKFGDGREAAREPVPVDTLDALTRWYTGDGDRRDEREAVRLVQRARTYERWFACRCLGDARSPPLLSPAYLSEAETYYLRRLVGAGRPEHAATCPFFREQALPGDPPEPTAPRPRERPTEFFQVLKPLPEHLSQRPEDDVGGARSRTRPTPRLARLLWRLMENAGLTQLEARPAFRPSIQTEFSRLIRAAQAVYVAPRQRLDEVLFTHPAAFHRKAVYAALRRREPAWPLDHEPQAFLALFCREIHGSQLRFTSAEPIDLATRVQLPTVQGRRVVGPYLVLVVVGRHPEARGYAPLRGYAQPILDGRHFAAIDSQFERDVLHGLIQLQTSLGREDLEVSIRKPVFDLFVEDEPCRPDFLLDCVDRRTGAVATIVLEAMGSADPDYLAAKSVTHPRMARLGALQLVRPADLATNSWLTDLARCARDLLA